MGISSNGVLNYNSQSIAINEPQEEHTAMIENNDIVDRPPTTTITVPETTLKPKPIEKDYIQQNYETESGKLAQIIIPKDATQDDLAAISDMLTILIKRRFKTDIK